MYKLIFPFLVILIFSCRGVFEKPAFNIETPKDWTRKDKLGSKGDNIIYLTSQKTNESIAIIGVHSFDIDTHIKLLISNIRKQCVFFENEEIGKTEFNHKIIRWIKYLAQYKISKVPVEQKIYCIQNGTFVFDISCTALKDSLNKMQPVIDDVINSFKFR